MRKTGRKARRRKLGIRWGYLKFERFWFWWGSLVGLPKVSLVGFGTFSVTKRAAHIGRNPQTGKEMKIAAKKVPKLTPGKGLKAAVK